MRLGSILKDPSDLGSSLNLREIPDTINFEYDLSDVVKLSIASELHKSNSLLASAASSIPIISAAASMGAKWGQDPQSTVEALNVRLKELTSVPEYMDEAMKNKAVIEYARNGLFAKSLYVVIGVATANELSSKEKSSAKSGANASAKAGVPQGVDIEISASHSNESGSKVELEVGAECDFAYRVREFEYQKYRRSKVREKGDYIKGALFGVRDTEENKDDVYEEFPRFKSLEEEDEQVPGLVVLG